MSVAAPAPPPDLDPAGPGDPHEVDPHADADGHAHHGHDPHSPHGHAHHFESWRQQFDAGKLGMWLFLAQEVLFFTGLFVLYAVYRARHPEVWEAADRYLSVPHGAFNTAVLLFSSLTMAWGVRAAMLGKRTLLTAMLAVTLFCAALFLGVKSFEYAEKAHAHILWAGAVESRTMTNTRPGDPALTVIKAMEAEAALGLSEAEHEERVIEKTTDTLRVLSVGAAVVALALLVVAAATYKLGAVGWGVGLGCGVLCAVGLLIGAEGSLLLYSVAHGWHGDEIHAGGEHGEGHGGDLDAEGHAADLGVTDHEVTEAGTAADGETTLLAEVAEAAEAGERPAKLGQFFSIYYAMTGVHAIHILAGMGVLIWLTIRAARGDFTPDYFGPVDFVGLYWHLVDLVWIYLFPLLYLIG